MQSAPGGSCTRTAASAKVKEPDCAISCTRGCQYLVGIKCKAAHCTAVALEALHARPQHYQGDYSSRCLYHAKLWPQELEDICSAQRAQRRSALKQASSTATGSDAWSLADHTFTTASLPPLTAKMLPLLHKQTLAARPACAATARSSVGCIMVPWTAWA